MNAPRAMGWILVGLLAWPLAATADVLRFMHTDLQGNVVAVTDESGAIIERRVYEPYGLPTAPIPDGPGYTGHDMDGETGLVYMQQRYYDPEIGRFLSIDPVGVNTTSGGNFNRYWYANANPYTYVDPDGRESIVRAGRIYIRPADPTVPKVSIPNNVGANGVSEKSLFFHKYNVYTPTNKTPVQVGSGIRGNPTPGEDAPASSGGTRNNAGSIPFHGDSNMVMSYSIESPDSSRYTDITVNYTISGEHGLHEGFVVRFGEISGDGSLTLRTYGEGDDAAQAQAIESYWGPKVESVWQQNHHQIIEKQ